LTVGSAVKDLNRKWTKYVIEGAALIGFVVPLVAEGWRLWNSPRSLNGEALMGLLVPPFGFALLCAVAAAVVIQSLDGLRALFGGEGRKVKLPPRSCLAKTDALVREPSTREGSTEIVDPKSSPLPSDTDPDGGLRHESLQPP
jgi:hypothetical protein